MKSESKKTTPMGRALRKIHGSASPQFGTRFPGSSRLSVVAQPGVSPTSEEPNTAGPVDGVTKTNLFTHDDVVFSTFRMKALVATNQDILLAITEGRKRGGTVWGDGPLFLRRGIDGGKT